MSQHQHRLFTVYIDEVQREIAKIRLAAWRAKATKETDEARNVYRGWFSQTAKILNQLEKAEVEMTIFEVIRYRALIEGHLQKIANENSAMHQNKRDALIRILNLLENVSREKHARLMQPKNALDPILGNNEDYKRHIRKITSLYTSHPTTIGYLNKIKLAVEDLINFLKIYIVNNAPAVHVSVVEKAIVNMLKVSEEKLRQDCLDMISGIRLMANKNTDLADFVSRHKKLLNLSPQDRSNSHVMYQLLKQFMDDLKKLTERSIENAEFHAICNRAYKNLIKRYQGLLKNNTFYINEKKLDQTSVDNVGLSEISGSHAPMRAHNHITHYLNAYEDISAPTDSIAGAYPAMIDCILRAEKVICIAGWELNLYLDYLHPEYTQAQHENSNDTLGKILIRKAIDNPNLVIAIKVWAQFWEGNMKYHHDAIKYLDKIARDEGFIHGIADLPNLQFRAVNHSGLFNSHHAKVLITDKACTTREGTQERKLTAFYGGLDLAADRMDDVKHTKHTGANIYGWRDVHQQITGPVVADVLNDFSSRWQHGTGGQWGLWDKWTKDKEGYDCFGRFCRNLPNTNLLNYDNLPQAAHDPLWQSQFLRSALEVSHNSFWVAPQSFECSIAEGYKQAISEAEHCIELETQYLIGGPGIHTRPKNYTRNPIPQAIVDKIIERHQAGQPFHAFITLPMLPNANSNPGTHEMDAIRSLQWQTIKWMMTQIEKQTGQPHWKYISFNFLAQWYGKSAEYDQKSRDKKCARQELVNAARRSQIYVHSKHLTVDNKLTICGSANANERSMGGKKGDTELAILSKPVTGLEEACSQLIIRQRRQNYIATLGRAFVDRNPECIEHPELFANERRELALNNLDSFMENSRSQADTGGASQLLTWPWLYSQETGHVGEYSEGCENLVDTPYGQEHRDCYRWHPENRSTILKLLGEIGIRPAN